MLRINNPSDFKVILAHDSFNYVILELSAGSRFINDDSIVNHEFSFAELSFINQNRSYLAEFHGSDKVSKAFFFLF